MKRTIGLLLLSVLIAEQSSAQSESMPAAPQYRHAIKVYNTLSSQTIRTYGAPYGPTGALTTSKQLDILSPSVAFMWMDKKGHTREIELSSFILNNKKDNTQMGATTLTGHKATTYDIALRLERIFLFAKNKSWRLKPALGVGVSPYFNMEKVIPYTTTILPSTETRWGVKAYFTPRINYNISERFFIDLNIPVTLANMGGVYQRKYIPAVGSEQAYATANFDAVSESPAVRLGVGFRF